MLGAEVVVLQTACLLPGPAQYPLSLWRELRKGLTRDTPLRCLHTRSRGWHDDGARGAAEVAESARTQEASRLRDGVPLVRASHDKRRDGLVDWAQGLADQPAVVKGHLFRCSSRRARTALKEDARVLLRADPNHKLWHRLTSSCAALNPLAT